VIQSRDAPYVYSRKKGPCMHQWLPTNYKLTSEDVCLIANDWEDEWKTPIEQMGHPKEEEEQEKMKKN
jgi:ubiquinone biosynthesis protein Coq4